MQRKTEGLVLLPSKRYSKTRKRPFTITVSLICVALAIFACVGIGASFAGAGSVNISGFGLGDVVASETASPSSALGVSEDDDAVLKEDHQLSSAASRDISQAIEEIDAMIEADRIAAEEAQAAEDAAKLVEVAANKSSRSDYVTSLSAVDWTVGEEAFVAEWTERINNYLAGSPLAGYGAIFAQAAWDYGVDPRFSPAIANTESSKGVNCFLPYNAWGWGEVSFSNWVDAIYTHVEGLSESYGYTLSYSGAKKYCPPNYDTWYKNTLSEMKKI